MVVSWQKLQKRLPSADDRLFTEENRHQRKQKNDFVAHSCEKINYPMTHPFVYNRNLFVMISVESEMVTMQYTFCLRFVKLNRKIVFSWFDPLLIMCCLIFVIFYGKQNLRRTHTR